MMFVCFDLFEGGFCLLQIYEQVVEKICDEICVGCYVVELWLLFECELVVLFQVGWLVVCEVFGVLQNEGFVCMKCNLGIYVVVVLFDVFVQCGDLYIVFEVDFSLMLMFDV